LPEILSDKLLSMRSTIHTHHLTLRRRRSAVSKGEVMCLEEE
jgi:hypothetical protein